MTSGSTDTGLEVRLDGAALWVRMDRPEAHNALTWEMADALAETLEGVVARDDVRVVVLAGTDSAFCTGADLSDPDAVDHLGPEALDRANRIIRAVVRLDRPVVAAVRGVAAGVGCSIAFAADLAVAAESASFWLAFGRIGLMPDGGATATIAASVGRARALRMALLNEPMSGRQAHEAGLVSHVAADDAFDEEVATLVRRLERGAPLAQAATKRALNAATLGGLDEALERERTGQSVLLRTADAAEGVAAFRERRRPDFHGG